MKGGPMYLVADSDDENIYLKRGGLATHRVTVPRARVASVSSYLIEIRVETTGGQVYRVIPGFLKKHREGASKAFAQWGVKV